jgi:hypothetical protein
MDLSPVVIDAIHVHYVTVQSVVIYYQVMEIELFKHFIKYDSPFCPFCQLNTDVCTFC